MRMEGKVVVVTGGTSGIGQVAAETLASEGARIVQVARDPVRGESALARLRERAPGLAHTVHYADLSRLSDMHRVAREIAAQESRVHVLLNNAGALFGSFAESEGLERTFALNHMSYFIFVQELRERLVAAAPARVVNTASHAHVSGHLDLEDLQSAKLYSRNRVADRLRYGGPAFFVYGRSKLCNILFTRELARRWAGTGVTANCLHPGFVSTRFGAETGGLISFGLHFAKLFALKPEQGAETLIYLASSPDVETTNGGYFYRCKLTSPSAEAQDDTLARRLWEATERLSQASAR
jgi:NAD(P)-dependent dehydrogenase (short-subunit alcohol dehydrogenase family)